MKQVAFCLSVVVALAGLDWADPLGSANVPQILDPSTLDATSHQRTFNENDGNITFTANYYDSNPACSGVPPQFAQLFVFSLEGLFINQFNAGAAVTSLGPKYWLLNVGIDAFGFGGVASSSPFWSGIARIQNLSSYRSS